VLVLILVLAIVDTREQHVHNPPVTAYHPPTPQCAEEEVHVHLLIDVFVRIDILETTAKSPVVTVTYPLIH